MTMFYCIYCDRRFDSNEQDHADYSEYWAKCQDCVDKEHSKRDGDEPKDDPVNKQTPVPAGDHGGGSLRRASYIGNVSGSVGECLRYVREKIACFGKPRQPAARYSHRAWLAKSNEKGQI